MNQTLKQDKLIQKALEYAQKHLTQHVRKDSKTYYEHGLNVFNTLVDLGYINPTLLAAAILHEGTGLGSTFINNIKTEFEDELFSVLSDYEYLRSIKIALDSPKNQNESYFIQTFINLTKNHTSVVLRMAERLENLRSCYTLDYSKRQQIALKSIKIYSPICRVIGLGKLAALLENESFKILNPSDFKKVSKIMKQQGSIATSYFEEVIPIVRELLKERNINATLKYRIKHEYGIYNKSLRYAREKGLVEKTFDHIYDKFGMRIIVENVDQCYETETILAQLWTQLPEERDDYIATPRKSGYQSIHNIFKSHRDIHFEVQIRTTTMNEYSEYGPASNFIYKMADKDARNLAAAKHFRELLAENPYWLKDLDYAGEETQSDNGNNVVSAIKPNPFERYIYTFTPKGDIIQLRKGATPIDFAYSIHANIGHSTIGCRINGKLEKLTTELNTGDTVEMLIQKNKKIPGSNWLDFAQTAKAKNAIRKALKRVV